MSDLDQADGARGALVENAIWFAQQGDVAAAIGILAGMSRAEREEFGPYVRAVLPPPLQAAVAGALIATTRRVDNPRPARDHGPDPHPDTRTAERP